MKLPTLETGEKKMDVVVKIFQVVGPLLTVGLAVFGFFVWYWQVAAKRKFEIAEQAISVWRKASDAISFVRNSFVRDGEGNSIALDEQMTGTTKENARRLRFVFERLENIDADFKDVRITQILVDLHISSQMARAFDVLFGVRHHVRVDAEMLIADFKEQFEAPLISKEKDQEWLELRREYLDRRQRYRMGLFERRDRNGKPHATDVYSQALDEAAAVVESECRRILKPLTPLEYLNFRANTPSPHEWSSNAKDVFRTAR